MSLAWATITRCVMCPLMSSPRMSWARALASSGLSASFTPPAFPRPPTFTCALTTTGAEMSRAMASACSGVSATPPGSTGTPCEANRSRAWYSKRSTNRHRISRVGCPPHRRGAAWGASQPRPTPPGGIPLVGPPAALRGPGEHRQAHGVGVLLDHGLDDLLRGLVQAGVDHLHAGVAQRAGDHLGPAVVPVQAGLADDHPNAFVHHGSQPRHPRGGSGHPR